MYNECNVVWESESEMTPPMVSPVQSSQVGLVRHERQINTGNPCRIYIGWDGIYTMIGDGMF